jgi:hypothetical protein
MPWLKYRHKFAHGKGSWSWRDLGPASTFHVHDECISEAESIVEELAEEYNFSDKYRGLDFEIIDDQLVPLHVVESAIERNADIFRQCERNAQRLDEQHKIVSPCPTCSKLRRRLSELSALHVPSSCPDCGRARVILKPNPTNPTKRRAKP